MNRERGFTLYELLVVLLLSGTVGMATAGALARLRSEEAASEACVRDLTALRRAARVVTEELRAAGSIGEIPLRLVGDRLLRDGREIARGVSVFEVRGDGVFAEVRLVIGGELRFSVRMRNAGRER